jgi:hypothetical protein
MNSQNRGTRVLTIGTVIVGLGFLCAIYLARARALARIAEANPLRHVGRLRGLPTLIHYRDQDWLMPPAEHALKLVEAIGPACKARSCPSMGLAQVIVYDPRDILAFLKAHADPKTPVLLLHGSHQTASVWTQLPQKPEMSDRLRLKMTDALRKEYSCRAVEIGPDSWGNDASVAALDKEAGPTGKVVLLGETMGTVTMWRWAEMHPERVEALVGVLPIYDLKRIATGPWGREVRLAYGSL